MWILLGLSLALAGPPSGFAVPKDKKSAQEEMLQIEGQIGLVFSRCNGTPAEPAYGGGGQVESMYFDRRFEKFAERFGVLHPSDTPRIRAALEQCIVKSVLRTFWPREGTDPPTLEDWADWQTMRDFASLQPESQAALQQDMDDFLEREIGSPPELLGPVLAPDYERYSNLRTHRLQLAPGSAEWKAVDDVLQRAAEEVLTWSRQQTDVGLIQSASALAADMAGILPDEEDDTDWMDSMLSPIEIDNPYPACAPFLDALKAQMGAMIPTRLTVRDCEPGVRKSTRKEMVVGEYEQVVRRPATRVLRGHNETRIKVLCDSLPGSGCEGGDCTLYSVDRTRLATQATRAMCWTTVSTPEYAWIQNSETVKVEGLHERVVNVETAEAFIRLRVDFALGEHIYSGAMGWTGTVETVENGRSTIRSTLEGMFDRHVWILFEKLPPEEKTRWMHLMEHTRRKDLWGYQVHNNVFAPVTLRQSYLTLRSQPLASLEDLREILHMPRIPARDLPRAYFKKPFSRASPPPDFVWCPPEDSGAWCVAQRSVGE